MRYLDTEHREIKKSWSPINDKFYQDDSSGEDDETDDLEDVNQEDHIHIVRVFPITPPPSNEVRDQVLIIEGQEESPVSSPIDLELHLSDSESSPETIINTSLEVFDGDDME